MKSPDDIGASQSVWSGKRDSNSRPRPWQDGGWRSSRKPLSCLNNRGVVYQHLESTGNNRSEVSVSGNHSIIDFRKSKTLALGVYPDVGVKDARSRRDVARKHLADGIDPTESRKAGKAAPAEAGANTFEVIAQERHAQRVKSIEQSTLEETMIRTEKHLFTWLGNKSFSWISAPDLLAVLRRGEAKEFVDTPRRLRQYCRQI